MNLTQKKLEPGFLSLLARPFEPDEMENRHLLHSHPFEELDETYSFGVMTLLKDFNVLTIKNIAGWINKNQAKQRYPVWATLHKYYVSNLLVYIYPGRFNLSR